MAATAFTVSRGAAGAAGGPRPWGSPPAGFQAATASPVPSFPGVVLRTATLRLEEDRRRAYVDGVGDVGAALVARAGGPTATTGAGGARTVSGSPVTVSLSASPTSPKVHARVRFTVRVSDTEAHGALGYRIAYGDGTSGTIALPQYCTAGSRAASRTWHLEHRYAKKGSYRVRVTGSAVCTAGSASAHVTISVR